MAAASVPFPDARMVIFFTACKLKEFLRFFALEFQVALENQNYMSKEVKVLKKNLLFFYVINLFFAA